ncbi:hypothetical protein BC833DRAFT_564077 [Globomyces pollinis-pini]|nr:hypothetical protein BC833DRAFT_564077 [Globomyces pollinis-pini]
MAAEHIKISEFNQSYPEKEPLLERFQKGILSSREESRAVSRTVGHTKISKLIEAFNSLSNSKNGSKYSVFISEWNNLYSLATHNDGTGKFSKPHFPNRTYVEVYVVSMSSQNLHTVSII